MIAYHYTCPDEVSAKLHQEIEADIGPCECVTWSGSGTDETEICFLSSLSAGDKTALDALVAAHDPTPATPPASYQWCEVSPGVIALCNSEGVEVTDKRVRLMTETDLIGPGKKVIRASSDGTKFYSKINNDGTKDEGLEV